ncbi:hypothetical protein [Vibrio sp. D431a]|uniref:hypothetical protein n=1 Tax=Vibrio sp. D431a TaxID=2837388 RepID=UPI002555B53F|nr:hypothetical protein [Vibrio sp. D431a]MDK9789944.1 hypothetical protein [Vibrio sp. D431a]
MGWYCHPDTMALASADAKALKEVGNNDRDSLAYKVAFRRIYDLENRGDGAAGLSQYLKELDQEIEGITSSKISS